MLFLWPVEASGALSMQEKITAARVFSKNYLPRPSKSIFCVSPIHGVSSNTCFLCCAGAKQYPCHPIWKESEHETTNFQAVSDLAIVEALLNYGLLKFFRVPTMKAYIYLLEYIIDMWDLDQQHFVVGTHILTLDI